MQHIGHHSPDPAELQRMADNLEFIQQHLTEPNQHHPRSHSPHSRPSQLSHKSSPPSYSRSPSQSLRPPSPTALRAIYEDYLTTHPLPHNHEHKIAALLEQPPSPGNAIALFEMLHYFKEAIQPEIVQEIHDRTATALMKTQQSEETQCYAELIAQCGVEDEELCQFVAENMLEGALDFQPLFMVLCNQGATGLAYLINLANRDLPLSHKIVDHLSRSEPVILALLIPTLITTATDPLPRHRDLALAALNRLAPLLTPAHLTQLISLLHDPTLDKKLLIATIRCAGLVGEQTVLDLINSKQWGDNITSLAVCVLSWRVPSKPALRIKAIEYTMEHSFLPGRLYQYEGSLQPWDYQQQDCPDSLCLSARDFLARLQQLLKQQPEAFSPSTTPACLSLSQLVPTLHLEDPPAQLSQETLKTLVSQLRNKNKTIREVALLEIGNIGPTAAHTAEAVAKCLSDNDSSIRSAACWTIARLSHKPNRKIEQKLAELLKDHFWKVRTSACIALGLILTHPQPQTIQTLIRTLQDGSIPKPTVCETLARAGAEELLLEILRGSPRNDFKLREAVLSSFQFASPHSPLLPALVEQLLRHSRAPRIETRQLCLVSLSALRQQLPSPPPALSHKHLLPFYYCFLDDPAPAIRTLAADTLLQFGTQAELIFIEGMAKGHPLAKIQCVRCLGRLGPQNFRAVALGLRDEDERVRRAACETILQCFTAEEVVGEFGTRQKHSVSLVCSLREVLAGPVKHPELRTLVQQILAGLEGSGKQIGSLWMDENVSPNL